VSAERRAERRRLAALLRRDRRRAKARRRTQRLFRDWGIRVVYDDRVPPGRVYIGPPALFYPPDGEPAAPVTVDGWTDLGFVVGDVTFTREPFEDDDVKIVTTARQTIEVHRL
jgi:hypothetical protein